MAIELSAELIAGKKWHLHRQGEPPGPEIIRLAPGGAIIGFNHPGARAWSLRGGALEFLTDDLRASTRFIQAETEGNRLVLSGPNLVKPEMTICLTEVAPDLPRRPGMREEMAEDIARFGWEIGEHTYGKPTIFDGAGTPLKIGKYCAIAGGVSIALANHRTDLGSTYPFISLRDYWPGAPAGISDHRNKGAVTIGNDVWIGANAFIGAGVTVGDGAVIAAHAVVTKNIPPYAIAAGNPATVKRTRFAPPVVTALLEIAWWNWPDQVVNAYLPLIMSPDIERFIARARADGSLAKYRK